MEKKLFVCIILSAQLLVCIHCPAQTKTSKQNNSKGLETDTTDIESKYQFPKPKDFITPEMQSYKLPGSINSDLLEMGPLVSADGKTLFFSRCKQLTNNGNDYFSAAEIDSREDIWFAKWNEDGKKWDDCKNIGAPLNNEYPNYINSISPDGNTILLGNKYFKDGQMRNGLSQSHFVNGTWSFPENLSMDGESKCFNWGGSFLSNSGKILIIACEQKKNNYGNGDLYISRKKPDNTWSEPVNLGFIINSVGSESSPFLSSDEKIIFYASNGLGGFGGNDLFMSCRLDESWTKWSKPANLGSKINTKKEESFFEISPSDGKIYYSTESDETGNLDIYCFDKPESEIVKTVPNETVTVKEPIVKEEIKKTEVDNNSGNTFNSVNFEFDKCTLNSNSEKEINKLFNLLNANPNNKIEITGYTDNSGPEWYNLALSYNRSKCVAKLLILKGMSKDRLIIKNLGSQNPVADNQTRDGRILNRRVTFKLISL